jgi:hypothetical protein
MSSAEKDARIATLEERVSQLEPENARLLKEIAELKAKLGIVTTVCHLFPGNVYSFSGRGLQYRAWSFLNLRMRTPCKTPRFCRATRYQFLKRSTPPFCSKLHRWRKRIKPFARKTKSFGVCAHVSFVLF